MNSLFELIYDYQRLTAKERMSVPLSRSEHARLSGLTSLLSVEHNAPKKERSVERLRCPVRVQLSGPHGFLDIQLRDISARGAGVALPTNTVLSGSMLLHLRDPLSGTEFVFPSHVAWCKEGRAGLVFQQVPSRHEMLRVA